MPVCPSLWHQLLGGLLLLFISPLSLVAVLHGALALLTAVQQLEQLNTIHDPPVAVQSIPNPSYLVLQPAGFHSGDIKKKEGFSLQMKPNLMTQREIILMKHILIVLSLLGQ